jgi:SH3-like domain-containing protein
MSLHVVILGPYHDVYLRHKYPCSVIAEMKEMSVDNADGRNSWVDYQVANEDDDAGYDYCSCKEGT